MNLSTSIRILRSSLASTSRDRVLKFVELICLLNEPDLMASGIPVQEPRSRDIEGPGCWGEDLGVRVCGLLDERRRENSLPPEVK